VRFRSYIWMLCGVLHATSPQSFSKTGPQMGNPEFKLIDVSLPFCDAPRAFDLSKETFVEIENDLPGKTAYNGIVSDYRARRWTDFDAKIRKFKKEYEASPLIEAIHFIELQAELERLVAGDHEAEEEFKHLDQKFRELLVLYPKSSLLPTIELSFAKKCLESGRAQKALGIFREVREKYPFHTGHCFAMYGEAEAHFQLSHFSDANRTFQAINQKCANQKLKLGSKIRQIDGNQKLSSDPNSYEKNYEVIRDNDSALVSRFFPELVFNLGEMSYRSKKWDRALYFFNDFQRIVGNRHECHQKLKKRLADISLRKNKSLSMVSGQYLGVFEDGPKSDLGKFSRGVALLLDADQIGSGEFERRTKELEELTHQIKDREMNLNIRILRAVTLIDRKDMSEIADLKALKNSNPSFFDEALSSEIRRKLLVLQKEKGISQEGRSKKVREKNFWENTYSLFNDWFEKTPDQELFKELVSRQVFHDVSKSVSDSDFQMALRGIKIWSQSKLFERSLISSENLKKLISKISIAWLNQAPPKRKQIATWFVEDHEKLTRFFEPEGSFLWVQSALDLDHQENLKGRLKKWEEPRNLAQTRNVIETDYSSARHLILAKGFSRLGKYSLADDHFEQVKSPALKWIARLERVKNANQAKDYTKALDLGMSSLSSDKAENGKDYLPILKDSILLGRKWSYAERLFSFSRKMDLEQTEQLEILNVLGRSHLEMGQFPKAILNLENSIKMDPQQKSIAETKFYLAQALFKSGSKDQAKTIWNDIVAMKNDFWSPLAENEIKLLEKP